MIELRRFLFSLQDGWGAAAATEKGLIVLVPRRETKEMAEKELAASLPESFSEVAHLEGTVMNEQKLEQLAGALNAYYQGDKVSLDFPVDWESTGVTDFQRRALEECKKITYGNSATYGDLARSVDNPKASRAIGGAMHINPVSLVVP
jgi:O6-methylguanine-DNA--protein-cysteine methyltransferase